MHIYFSIILNIMFGYLMVHVNDNFKLWLNYFCYLVVVFRFDSRTFCAVTVIVLMQAPGAHGVIGYFLLYCTLKFFLIKCESFQKENCDLLEQYHFNSSIVLNIVFECLMRSK